MSFSSSLKNFLQCLLPLRSQFTNKSRVCRGNVFNEEDGQKNMQTNKVNVHTKNICLAQTNGLAEVWKNSNVLNN